MADCGVTRVTNCSICLGTYKKPRVLPCGHTFCLYCIKEHGKSKGSDPDCPNCRIHFQIPSDGFETLPKNFCLSSMSSESLSAVDMSKATVKKRLCEKHNSEELLLYCLQCNDVICLDCLEDAHHKHDFSKISTFAKSARTQLEGYVKIIKPILSQVTSQISMAEEESKKFLDLLDKTELAINEEYENTTQFVSGHRRLLLEELSTEKRRITKALKMKTDEIETECLRLSSFITRIEELLQGTDEAMTFDLVHQYKHFRYSFDKLVQIQPPDMAQFSNETIKFISADLKDFIRKKGNAVGRLQKESDSRHRAERSRLLRKDLTPSNEQVDLSLSQRVPTDPHAFYYLECEHPNEEAFDFTTTICTLNNLDQHEMEEQMAALELNGIDVILNNDKTFRLEGNYENVEKAIKQLQELRMKVARRNTSKENKEQISNNCDPVKPKVERNWLLQKHLAPSNEQLDLSLSQRVPIDPHVWYFLERKHPNKVDGIAKKHMCISRIVYESSNEGITHYLEVAPYALDDANEARKHVDDVVEEFAQLYQTVSKLEIVEESIKLPLAFDQNESERLIAQLEEMGVFFLRSDGPCLVGPRSSIEEAKQKVIASNRVRNDGSAREMQPDVKFSLAQASAAESDDPLNFKTTNGLKVYVSKGDLVRQSVDAIVNPANEDLRHGGGVAGAIAKAAGELLQQECKDFIKKYGKLQIIGSVMHTTAGNLKPKIKFVIHAVGPKKSSARGEEELFGLVKLTVFNSLCYANDKLKIHSVAIPAISSGIFGVPIEIVGRASFEALEMFDSFYAASKQKSLREIHFLNKDNATSSSMKRIFRSLKKNDHRSSFDPERRFKVDKVMELLDRYAEVVDRQRIETTLHDGCFARALATALQKDFQSNLDWCKVDKMIRKELDNNEDYMKFCTDEETGKQWSWADVVKNPLDAFADKFLNEDKKSFAPDLWINAAANALEVQIVLVLLSAENVPVERHFEPRSNVKDTTVFVAYHCCGHHHFDALVKISNLEGSASGKNMSTSAKATPAGIIKKSSNPDHSHNINDGLSQTHMNDDDFEKLSPDEVLDMPPDNTSDHVGKKGTKEKASNVTGKKADDEKALDVAGKKVDDEKALDVAGKKGTDDKKEDDDNHCTMCLENITDKKELPCKHKFCRECIDNYFAKCQPKCPSCGKVFKTLRGNQPEGTMSVKESSLQNLPGYSGCGTIEIEYYFGDGIQGGNHPNPGQPYRGTHQKAYLPGNKEGREVVRLLRSAFDAGLVFMIGRSNTTGRDNVVICDDIPLKTSPNGQSGYPDQTYLKHVKEKLAAKGIQ